MIRSQAMRRTAARSCTCVRGVTGANCRLMPSGGEGAVHTRAPGTSR